MAEIKRTRLTIADLRGRLDDFERRYTTPSARLADAFRDERGELTETADFHRWCRDYSAWELAARRCSRATSSTLTTLS